MNNRNSNSLAFRYQLKASGARALACSLFALLFFSTLANAQCGPNCLFYGGDLVPIDSGALANENDAIVSGNPYGAAVYQNFIVPTGQAWNVAGLFTNNLSDLHPASAYFEIRTGVSSANSGTLVASGYGSMGAGTFTWTATGRSFMNYDEFTAQVTGLNIALPSGTYWESVVPQSPNEQGRSLNSSTDAFRQNGVGEQITDSQFFNSPVFGANFDNTEGWAQGTRLQTFSSGVNGYLTPEPSSLIMLGSGVLCIGGLLRRRLLG